VQNKGLELATEKLLQIAVEDYCWKMPSTNTQDPVNFEDIVVIISNKEWYNSNISFARKQLWMMQYGIFRADYDDWIRKFENDWMAQQNISYIPKEKPSIDGTKGFIYTIASKYAGNYICDRFKRKCALTHGEFISNRKRKNRDGENNTYIPTKLHRFMAYVVQVNNPTDPIMECLEIENQHIRQVRMVINRALDHGVDGDKLKNYLIFVSTKQKVRNILFD
jgi:hypothetical protein